MTHALLDHYSEEDLANLTNAAEAHSDLIDIAAKDPLCDGYVNGLSLIELWPFVMERRDELAKQPDPEPEAVPEPRKDPVAAPKAKAAPATPKRAPYQRRSAGKK